MPFAICLFRNLIHRFPIQNSLRQTGIRCLSSAPKGDQLIQKALLAQLPAILELQLPIALKNLEVAESHDSERAEINMTQLVAVAMCAVGLTFGATYNIVGKTENHLQIQITGLKIQNEELKIQIKEHSNQTIELKALLTALVNKKK